MKHLILFIGVLSALTLVAQAQAPRVEIFYETLSDAGRKFFVEQFKIVADNLLDRIDLRLYPYGNTELVGDVYTCPFGDAQCEANKLHACLINQELQTSSLIKNDPVQSWVKGKNGRDIIADPINAPQVASFVNCFFKNRYAHDNIEALAEECLPNDANADWSQILLCAREEDTTLTDALADHTGTVVGAVIQTDGFAVSIDGTPNEAANTNLLGELCNAISETTGVCAQTTAPPKVKLAVYYEAFNTDAGNYLVKQLGTYYHVLEDFVDIDLIAYGNTLYDAPSQTYNCTQDPQCISNKFQALVVDKYIGKPLNGDPISGENRAINFISCVFTSNLASVFQALEACANQRLEVDDYHTFLEYIKMDGDEVRNVFDSMRQKTAAVATNGVLPRVPVITLNEQVDYNAFDDLVQEACAQYTGLEKAKICTKVNLTIIYEPLNHKSRTLFLEQLNPAFSNLYNLVNLQLNPAGRAVILPGAGFVCQSGIDQCTAMKLQVCALDYFWNDGNNYTDPIRQEVFEFLVCTFKNKKFLNVMDAAEVCSEQHIEIDAWFTIHGCLMDGTANGILGEYIEEAQSTIANIGSHNIPIVILNDAEVTDFSNIKQLICELFDAYHAPDYCFADAVPKVQIQVYYEAMNELSKYFFTTQFQPWYIYVEEMADIELLPAGNKRETNDDGTCDSNEIDSVCLANKIQAVVIDKYSKNDDDGDYIDGTLRTAEFVGCYFNHPNFKDNVYTAAEYCTEEKLLQDEWFDLIVTVLSPVGSSIYQAVVQKTQNFITDNNLPTLELPWITLDANKHSKRAQDDLLQTICSQYLGDKPPECTPVQLQVYYSAINPQSRRFFLDQLIPIYRNLRERIHLDLIPYGVANPELTLEQECATKDKTCQANKFQACAIDLFFKDEIDADASIQWDGKNQTLSFITCMFRNIKNMNIAQLAEECALNNIILADKITECALQQNGVDLLTQMRRKTLGQYENMEHAPWIVINGLRSSLAQSDLKQAVCDALVGDKPNYCSEATPPKVKVDFHYTTVDNAVQSYVINELYPHYRLMEEIIDLDVIPFGLMEVLEQGNGDYTTHCPNGIQECRANIIHACIYNQYYHADDDPVSDSQDEREYDHKLMVIEFINCYFHNAKYPAKPVDASMECVEQIFGDDFSTVHECTNSNLGIQLMLDYEKKVNSLLPHLTYTPWITMNNRHSYSIEHHIQRAVCDAYTGREKPLDCYQIYDAEDKPYVYIHYEIGDNSSGPFFTNVLDATLSSGIANIHLVPFGRSTYTTGTKECVNDAECSQYYEHACIIDLYYETESVQVLQTISCTFGDLRDDPNVVNECVDIYLDHIPDAWSQIRTCVLDKGDELLTGHATTVGVLNPKISHVPWIIINEEHNIEAEVDFVDEICYVYYPDDKPALCKPDLIPVGVYYETLNTGVQTFFLNQLSQYTEYLDEIGNFTFIPYGTTTNNGDQFTCSQANQCTGNIAHACILNRLYNQSSINSDSEYVRNRIRVAGFLQCVAYRELLGETDPILTAEECLDLEFEGDFWRDIHFCFSSPEGAQIYAEMGRQTAALAPPLTSAPYVTIGGQYSENAVTNLFQALCNSYLLVKAPLCATLPSLAIRVGIYFSANAAAQQYFREQVLPFYAEIVPQLRAGTSEAQLHTVIAPDLVAWGETKYDATSTNNPFTCAGGPNECYVNRLFACVEHYHGQEKKYNLHKMQFALCFFSQSNALNEPQAAANQCTNRVWIPDPFIQLDICAIDNSPEGIDIFLHARDKTENVYPHLTTFPSITINNQPDANALQNLLQVVCQKYPGYDAPDECAAYTTDLTTPTFTTDPSTTPTVPSTTPTVPSTTPTVPSTTPTVPSTTPTVPSTTPTVPSTTPTVPSTTPTVPSTTPTVPSTTPTVPSTTPTVPSTTPTITETPTMPPPGAGIRPSISIVAFLFTLLLAGIHAVLVH